MYMTLYVFIRKTAKKDNYYYYCYFKTFEQRCSTFLMSTSNSMVGRNIDSLTSEE